jgi:hypothetical protein
LCWAFYYSRETLCSRGKLNRQCHPCLTTLASRHSSIPPGPEVGSQGVVRRAVSRDRKYGEHRCRTAPSVSAVSQCFDRSARRSECRLVGLVSDLPRRPTFLPREGKAASHSMSAVGDPSARGSWATCTDLAIVLSLASDGGSAGLASRTTNTGAIGNTWRICMNLLCVHCLRRRA